VGPIAIIVLTLLAIPVVLLTEGVVRVVLGAAFVAFFPGYALLAALFPARHRMDGVERIVMSFLLSIAVTPLIGLILNFTPWGIKIGAIVAAVASLILVAAIIALLRRRGLSEEERFDYRVRFATSHFVSGGKVDKVLFGVFLLLAVAATAGLAYVLVTPRPVERFTEFYLLGSGSMTENYPQEATVGQPIAIPMAIVNHEGVDTSYRIQATIDDVVAQEIGPIGVADGGKWEDKATITPSVADESERVQFDLYRQGDTAAYLTVYIWLNVRDGG
jgi:uncharacterized membrane protein